MPDTGSLVPERMPASDPFTLMPPGIGRVIAAARLRWRTLATRRSLRQLTPEQLKDIGYPEPCRPRIEVKAGLIANLVSMR